MYVCVCQAVTERDIHQAVANGANNLRDLRKQLRVGTCCGLCIGCARDVLHEAQSMCAKTCQHKICAEGSAASLA